MATLLFGTECSISVLVLMTFVNACGCLGVNAYFLAALSLVIVSHSLTQRHMRERKWIAYAKSVDVHTLEANIAWCVSWMEATRLGRCTSLRRFRL